MLNAAPTSLTYLTQEWSSLMHSLVDRVPELKQEPNKRLLMRPFPEPVKVVSCVQKLLLLLKDSRFVLE